MFVTRPVEHEDTVLYYEKQWLPWYWWVVVLGMVTAFCLQLMFNRTIWWFVIPELVLGAAALWFLFWMSSTTVSVTEDREKIRWLQTDGAALPHIVVSRSLAIPASAKQAAMGRQLDPAAFLVSHAWVPTMVMLVIEEPDDPTPYWLVSAKDPAAILKALVPDQAAEATRSLDEKQS